MGLTLAVLAFLLTGAHAGWSVTVSHEYGMFSKDGTTMMYKATEESACFLTGMLSTYKHSYDCNIIQEKESGLSGLYWKLQGSGYSGDQRCYAVCIKWGDSSTEASDMIDATPDALDATPAALDATPAALQGLNTTSSSQVLSSEYQQLVEGYQTLLPLAKDTVCFLTGMYSSAKHSYVCRIEQLSGNWRLKAEGASTAQRCYARCLSGLNTVDKTTASGVTEEFSLITKEGETYMASTANNAACFLTGMHSAYAHGYYCRMKEMAISSGTYWYLYGKGDSGVQGCYARCLPFLTWTVPKTSWKQLDSVGYGSYSKSVAYGVSSTDNFAMHKSWGKSVSATVEAVCEFGSASLTAEASTSVALSMEKSLTLDQTSTFTVSCASNGEYLTIFQWIATMSHPEDEGSTPTEVKNSDFFCLYGGTGNWVPKCPLGYCADKTCQTCANGWKA